MRKWWCQIELKIEVCEFCLRIFLQMTEVRNPDEHEHLPICMKHECQSVCIFSNLLITSLVTTNEQKS